MLIDTHIQSVSTMLVPFLLVCMTGAAEVSSDDRMEGNSRNSRTRTAPDRDFNTALPRGERLHVYSGDSPSGRFQSDDVRSSGSRYFRSPQHLIYQPHINRVDDESTVNQYIPSDESGEDAPSGKTETEGNENNTVAENPPETSDNERDADPEMKEDNAPRVERAVVGNRTVYCSRRLREYHWTRTCRMLNIGNPTPMTLSSALSSAFIECSECRKTR